MFYHCVLQANVNSENMKLVAAILVAALYPNVVQILVPENKYLQSSAGNTQIIVAINIINIGPL